MGDNKGCERRQAESLIKARKSRRGEPRAAIEGWRSGSSGSATVAHVLTATDSKTRFVRGSDGQRLGRTCGSGGLAFRNRPRRAATPCPRAGDRPGTGVNYGKQCRKPC